MTNYVAGYNMPGYMPDSEPAEFETFDSARDNIVFWLDDALESMATGEEKDEEKESVLKDAIEYAKKQTDAFSFTAAGYCYWVTPAH
ncbi:hypothetical protein F6X40_17155 [Paraburkholderia sp. UCT31]|uniref:hypothetical protein n=1 Tax=Paraburkholderia sp. UCT31 TaxID=2615209 RepID=UPI0016563595|nr:hypothetical protein [Paraburkholderia sp. UCT31]MBC8738504.1 hypothetical protein [Paraburkholderia sp. UCT31]